MRRIGRAAAIALAFALAQSTSAIAAPAADRSGEAVVLDGKRLEKLEGTAPKRLRAFAYRERGRRGGRFTPIPVQVDERVLVDFGAEPKKNSDPGVDGTVYGTAPIGQAVLQYADPETFVGADPDRKLDPDDEVALIAADAGERAPKRAGKPRGVKGASGERVELRDRVSKQRSYVYLFASKGRKAPTARKDYVEYDFALASGEYRSTYRRADGPNPETSRIRTDAYEAGFSDRWLFDHLRIRAGKADGSEILDGFKFGFGPGVCGRSERTFSDAEGAFVGNLDGPVRAIRSYVGANSGPLTQRTHYFYPSRHEIVTDLRVHAVPGPLAYHDLSEAGIGMEFRNSENPGGVTVDGVPDQLSGAPAEWRMWAGRQGSLFAADRLESSFTAELAAGSSEFYLDDAAPPFEQCWGDGAALGQAGYRSTTPMPNTDPRQADADFLHTTTTEVLASPAAGAKQARRLSRGLDSPLAVRTR